MMFLGWFGSVSDIFSFTGSRESNTKVCGISYLRLRYLRVRRTFRFDLRERERFPPILLGIAADQLSFDIETPTYGEKLAPALSLGR
jgi:hypothetical protein